MTGNRDGVYRAQIGAGRPFDDGDYERKICGCGEHSYGSSRLGRRHLRWQLEQNAPKNWPQEDKGLTASVLRLEQNAGAQRGEKPQSIVIEQFSPKWRTRELHAARPKLRAISLRLA
jgi:hypothetical protein